MNEGRKKKKLVRVCFAHRTIFWFDVRSNVMFRPRCSLFFYLSSLLSSRSVTFSRFLSFSFFSSIFLSSGMVVCRPPSAIHSHRHCRNCSTDWFRLCRLWNFRKITRRVASGVPTSAIIDLLECNKCWYNRGTNFKNFYYKNGCNIFKSKIIENIFCK